MDTFCENLAHFIHGAAFMFFILASIQLYPLRHRSNMMRLLFCSMIFLAFLEFKDMGFLIKGVFRREVCSLAFSWKSEKARGIPSPSMNNSI